MLTASLILIFYNALKVGNVDFTVSLPTAAQYDAIFAGANTNGPLCPCAVSTIALQVRTAAPCVTYSNSPLTHFIGRNQSKVEIALPRVLYRS
jgi:hypothetical protein